MELALDEPIGRNPGLTEICGKTLTEFVVARLSPTALYLKASIEAAEWGR